MTGIERVGFHNPWLYPLAAEPARTEILKMTGTANKRASHLKKIAACQKANLNLKRVKPVEETSAINGTKKVSPGGDHLKEKAVASYKRERNLEDEKGRNIDISLKE